MTIARCGTCGCFTHVTEGDLEWVDDERPDLGKTIYLYADCTVCGGEPKIVGEVAVA